MHLLVQCIYMFVLHTMRPFDACFPTRHLVSGWATQTEWNGQDGALSVICRNGIGMQYNAMKYDLPTCHTLQYDAVKLVAQALGGAKGSYRLVSMLEVPGNNGNWQKIDTTFFRRWVWQKVGTARGCRVNHSYIYIWNRFGLAAPYTVVQILLNLCVLNFFHVYWHWVSYSIIIMIRCCS